MMLEEHCEKNGKGQFKAFTAGWQRFAYYTLIVLASIAAGSAFLGCSNAHSSLNTIGNKPRIRKGFYFGSVIPINFIAPEDLGTHNISEKNGIIYCCRAGFIDTGHLRKSADWTNILADKIFDHIMKEDSEFSFKLREPSEYIIKLEYPEFWRFIPQEDKQKTAREVSIHLGQYFAYTACTWHEILTWFGYTWTKIGSEYISAFSWEDIYSNLLGSHIGAAALRDEEHSFNQAVTLAIDKELKKLGAQPANVTRQAAKEIKGKWYTGGFYFFVNMKKRNFDIGLDGYVSPSLVPSICEGASAISYSVPDALYIYKRGFSMQFEIDPRVMVKNKILRIVYPDGDGKTIRPDTHFYKIMDYIKKKAQQKPDLTPSNQEYVYFNN